MFLFSNRVPSRMRPIKNRLLLFAAAAVLGTALAHAQESVHVRIETNYPHAVLYADSLLIGTVTNRPVAVPATSRMLRLAPPDQSAWSVAPVSVALEASPGDTVAVRLTFPYHYRVESIPFGAEVLLENGSRRSRIGETPLLYRANRPLDGLLVIGKAGYALERVSPGRDVWNRHVVSLEPSDHFDPSAAQVNWRPPGKRHAWIDYAALGSALVAGALAVHYKFKADALYEDYEETGSPRLRSDIQRYDTSAGIAFGTMQVGIGVFAVRLALR